MTWTKEACERLWAAIWEADAREDVGDAEREPRGRVERIARVEGVGACVEVANACTGSIRHMPGEHDRFRVRATYAPARGLPSGSPVCLVFP